MLSIEQVQTWTDLAIVLAWTLCVLGTVKAIFGSFWADELRAILMRRWRPDVGAIKRLQWEVQHQREWSPEGVKDPLVARQPLTQEMTRDRQRQLARMQTVTLPRRVIMYSLGCAACQSFWVALGLQLLTIGPGRLGWCVLSALMYASSAGVIQGLGGVIANKSKSGGGCNAGQR